MPKVGAMVPELVNLFNVYYDNKLIGIDGDVDLPEWEAVVESLTVAGVMGEIDVPATGHFASGKTAIRFAAVHEDVFKGIDTTKQLNVTLRASVQFYKKESTAAKDVPVKINLLGRATKVKPGKFTKGKKQDTEIELETAYMKITVNNEVMYEIDKYNCKYVVMGKDLMETIRKNI